MRRHSLEPFAAGLELRNGLDPAVAGLAAVARPFAEGRVRQLLFGQWLGHALHPLLTGFPLGCWTSASLLDTFRGQDARPASPRLVGLGVLATLPTAAAGMSEWAHTDRHSQRVGVVHAAANGAALGLYGDSYLARRRGRHAGGNALGMAGGVVSIVSGFLGGHLSLTAAVTRDNALAADPEPHAPVSA